MILDKEYLKTYAPMIVDDEQIRKNSMKLYSYLLCISGLAFYPENTKIFQHKNLSLTKIKEATGITDKTAKLYLYHLERNGLVEYQGRIRQPYIDISDFTITKDNGQQEIDKKAYKKAVEQAAFSTWKHRNSEEKDEYYRIPRPVPYTPIPEQTLEKLNQVFEITETEMKLYVICCRYRDLCCKDNSNFQNLTFESIRKILNLQQNSKTNSNLRRALLFLKSLGLIDFTESILRNDRGAIIPCFKLTEVYYYISYKINVLSDDSSLEAQETIDRLKEYDSSCF